jgi:hypothetical protein
MINGRVVFFFALLFYARPVLLYGFGIEHAHFLSLYSSQKSTITRAAGKVLLFHFFESQGTSTRWIWNGGVLRVRRGVKS